MLSNIDIVFLIVGKLADLQRHSHFYLARFKFKDSRWSLKLLTRESARCCPTRRIGKKNVSE